MLSSPPRPAAGLLPNGGLLPEPLPGGAPSAGGRQSLAGVPGDSPGGHPRAQGPAGQAYLRRPLCLQGRNPPNSTFDSLSSKSVSIKDMDHLGPWCSNL